jgi:hypothetical protein
MSGMGHQVWGHRVWGGKLCWNREVGRERQRSGAIDVGRQD